MNFIDVLNLATKGHSDYWLAKKLEKSTSLVSSWRTRGSIPESSTLDKLAALADMPAEKVHYIAYAEKVDSPIVAELLRQYAA